MREKLNPAQSGSRLFYSEDKRYILKTLEKEELDIFLRNIYKYYEAVKQGKETFLVKILGLYAYTKGSKTFIVMIMKNVLPSQPNMTDMYDFKGSSYNRQVCTCDIFRCGLCFQLNRSCPEDSAVCIVWLDHWI